jgi:glycyl-tRNA synthetase beta chain
VPEFLLEVGFEEMPAPWLEPLAVELTDRFSREALGASLDPRGARASWTPRRLVLVAEVLERQPDREEAVWGPSLKAARDASGAWTAAAQGFAKKNGVAVDALEDGARDPAKPEERYLLYVRETLGRAAVEVLPGVIAAALRGLSFPKRMSWDAWLDDGKGAFPFGRPIRWLVALLDGTVVPFVIYEMVAGAKGRALVASGPATLGHRFLPRETAGRPIPVRSFEELRDKLREACVVLDPVERKQRIEEQLGAVLGEDARKGGDYLVDHGHWPELVEHPNVVVGRIPAELHDLPFNVTTTVLRHHQKYIPIGPRHRGVVTRFAAVTNADAFSSPEIVRGMERVVVARLRDARFFYREDLKRLLKDRVADLAGVVFHKGLGTYLDKTHRLVRLVEAEAAAGLLGAAEGGDAVEAARLAKADLTTLMVREFPELQGAMGGIYLQAQGVSKSVAEAVKWHYGIPPADPSLHTRLNAAVLLADKLDTLAGYFGLGLGPTGSSDPFGLRRAALGAIHAVLLCWSADREHGPDLPALVAQAVAGYGTVLRRPADAVVADLESFLTDRLAFVLRAKGSVPEEIEAVLSAPERPPLRDVLDTQARVEALHAVRRQAPEDFAHLAVAFKRAKNILTQAEAALRVEPDLFQNEAERALHRAVSDIAGRDGDYDMRLKALAGLRGPVDRFFDDVLVMAEDPKLRGNRLALLSETLALFYRIADISKLGGQS